MPRTRSRLATAALAVAAVLAMATGVVASQQRNFTTAMSGAAEVPVRDTNGRGVAVLRLSDDGTAMSYKLIASNIENVFMAHIHIQPVGTVPGAATGPIGVWLAPSTTPGVTLPVGGGRHDGILATGTFTAANFVGPLAAQPMSSLLTAIQQGRAYVNVHTDDGVAPPNTGAGDFPGGEIRGNLP